MRPSVPVGRPPPSFFQCPPPSSVRYTALAGPPSISRHGSRCLSYSAAYSVCGAWRSITRSTAPVSSFAYSTLVQCRPPSLVLKTPRSAFLENRCPSAATYTTSGLRGSITMRAMCCESARPIACQVLPPSLVLKTPRPEYELRALALSPVPTQTVFGSLGAIASAPMDSTPALSKTGVQVTPPFVVFHTPPLRSPIQMV